MRNPWWVLANASSCRESTIKRESTINAILTFGSDWFCQIWLAEPNVVLETVRRHLARSLPLLGSEPGRLVGRSPSGSFNWPSIPLSSHLVSPFPLYARLGISSLSFSASSFFHAFLCVLLSFLALSPLLVILRAHFSFPSAYMCPPVSLPVSHLSAHLRPASYPRAPVHALKGRSYTVVY